MPRGIRRLLCRAGLVAVGLGGAALLVPATAGAVLPNPACGSTIYKSVKLHSNMNCPDSNGIIVGRSGITINLNGFALNGEGSGDYNGIDDTGGFNRVTVTNGTVEGFLEGVYFDGTKNANINNVTAQLNYYSIDVEDSTNGAVTNSTSDDNVFGIYLYQNHMVTVSNSDASYNELGIYDYGSLDTIDSDTMNYNDVCIDGTNACLAGVRKADVGGVKKADAAMTAYGDGLQVDYPLTSGGLYYTVEHSTADNNEDTGVQVDDNSPTTLYQAKIFSNTAEFNGQSGSGFGFWAYQQVKGYGNGVRGNASGNCYHVPCHRIP